MADVRAAVLVGPRKVELRHVPRPSLRDGDLLVRVEAAGICGTDVEIWDGRLTEFALPLVLGHEIVGTVEEGHRSDSSGGIGPGDRVIVEASMGCGQCARCLAGLSRHCAHGGSYGLRTGADVAPGLWGGFAEAVFVPPQAQVHRIPTGVSLEEAVLVTSVVANGVGWVVETGRCRLGDQVLIIGAGPQGMSCAAAARASGARQIMMVGLAVDAERMKRSAAFGVDHVIVGDEQDALTAVLEHTDGEGADLVVDASGSPATPQLALDAAALGGRIVHASQVGTTTPSSLFLDTLVRKEVSLHGVLSKSSTAIRSAFELVRTGSVPFSGLITHRFPLEDIEAAFAACSERSTTRPMKALVVPRTASTAHAPTSPSQESS